MADVDIYRRGLLTSHCSTEDGYPDVGISVGLGNGSALYAGEVPGADHSAWSLVIYTQDDRIDIATDINDRDRAIELVERIAGAIVAKPVAAQ